jgi:prepilin peptidase CpaA
MHAFLLFAVVVAGCAAVLDWRSGEIPNWLTFGSFCLAPLLHYVVSFRANGDKSAAMTEAGLCILGALVCVAVPLILYRQNAIGGGDLKLFGALGAIGQVSLGLEIELYGFLSMAFLAPAMLAYQGKLIATIKNSFYLLLNAFLPVSKRKSVESEAMSWFRLGPAILFGAVLTAVTHWKDAP